MDPLDMVSLSKRLDTKTAIVVYIPCKDGLYIMVLKSNESNPFKKHLPCSRDQLFKDVVTLANKVMLCTKDQWSSSLRNELHLMYRKLLQPVVNELQGKENVFIVPSGPLIYLPFGSLVCVNDETNLEFAAQRYRFGYITSLSMFQCSSDKKKNKANKPSYVIVGDPTNQELTHTRFRSETEMVKQVLEKESQGTLHWLVGQDATTDKLGDIHEMTLLHVAAKGTLSCGCPNDSKIELSGNTSLCVAATMSLPLGSTELVCVSCTLTPHNDSNDGNTLKAGEEYTVLCNAFSTAGAQGMLVTLWDVAEKSSTSFIKTFYELLVKGKKNTLIAASDAQRELIEQKASLNEWAPYAFVGQPAALIQDLPAEN